MRVSLVSVTGHEKYTPEELIVYIARVSNPSNQDNMETAPKLIKYLIDNKHWSPFEMVDMTVEIVTSRAIAQQILRHRSFSFQEFSQRYSAVTEMEPIQLRRQAEKNRQSSEEEFNPEVEYYGPHAEGPYETDASWLVEEAIDMCKIAYDTLLAAGVAKECARMVLPLTTQTTIYMKGSVRSWVHYLQIRCDKHTQLEHRQIADAIREEFVKIFPNISEALNF